MLSRLEIAESVLKAVGGFSVLAMLAVLAWPRRAPPRELEVQPSIEAHAPSDLVSRGEVRDGCLRCDPGVDCPCAKTSAHNVTYACQSGAPGPHEGVCLSRNYVRVDGKTYACWSCSALGDHPAESQE